MPGALPTFPTTNDELLERIVLDRGWFIQHFCDIIHSDVRKGISPFVFITPQRRYWREIVDAGIRRVIVGKSRKWGFSTLELADGLVEALTTPGFRYGVFAHKQETANNLNRTVKLLYESALNNLSAAGFNPHDFIPKPTSRNIMGYEFGDINAGVFLGTASGKGVGQSDRFDRVYATEYSDWEDPEQSRAGLEGSQPPGGKFIVDFNAHGKGNDSYTLYTRAKFPHDHKDWNGFTPFFAGVLDCPEIYTAEQLEQARRSLGPRFVEVYPSNDREMWLANELAVFNQDHIEETFGRSEGEYAGQCRAYSIGVDTASGAEGLDYQVAYPLGLTDDGIWQECEGGLHAHVPEDVFAEQVHALALSLPGAIVVVERNVGSAVLTKLRDLGTPNVYRHRHRDQTGKQYMQLGFPMTSATKRVAISDTQRMLRDGELALVDEVLKAELSEYEWKVREVVRGME